MAFAAEIPPPIVGTGFLGSKSYEVNSESLLFGTSHDKEPSECMKYLVNFVQVVDFQCLFFPHEF